jgi:hypothetical protein
VEKSHFEKELDRLLAAEPFRSFCVVLTNGSRYQVDNPALFEIAETIIHHYVPASDRFNILRMNQLAATEVLGAIEN